MGGSWYNGFSPRERSAKSAELKRQQRAGAVGFPTGPCMLCGDPDVPVEFHSEDYGYPYLFDPPAMYTLCRHCHRAKLHRRFRHPHQWAAFKAHVRRGGYARDLAEPVVKREVSDLQATLARGEDRPLRPLRAYAAEPGSEWFERLRTDPESLTDPSARPRGGTAPLADG